MKNLIVSLFILSSVSLSWADNADVHECHLLKTFKPYSGDEKTVTKLLSNLEERSNKDPDIQILISPAKFTVDERDASVSTLEDCVQKANQACLAIPEGTPTKAIESKRVSIWFNGERHNEDFKCYTDTKKHPLIEKVNAGLENLQQHIRTHCPLVDKQMSETVNPAKVSDVFKTCQRGSVVIDVIRGCSVPCAKVEVESYKHLLQISTQLKGCNINRSADNLDYSMVTKVFYSCQPGTKVDILGCPVACGNEVDSSPTKTEERKPTPTSIRSRI